MTLQCDVVGAEDGRGAQQTSGSQMMHPTLPPGAILA